MSDALIGWLRFAVYRHSLHDGPGGCLLARYNLINTVSNSEYQQLPEWFATGKGGLVGMQG
ncbi:MAG: hypothetical protein IPM37_03445 [Hahellaceae bacterium]|nr:hypothetical protein [Hahellaceae bacterium]